MTTEIIFNAENHTFFEVLHNHSDAYICSIVAPSIEVAEQLAEEYCAESGMDREITWDGFIIYPR